MSEPLRPFNTSDATLHADGWKSPDTYSREFGEIPRDAGIYIIASVQLDPLQEDYMQFEIAYIGMSKNLLGRAKRTHPAMRYVIDSGRHAKRFFKLHDPSSLRSEERRLIRLFRPTLNVMGNGRLTHE